MVKALRPIVRAGLPVNPDFGDETLLGLRGVAARSADPRDRLNRVKTLDQLIRKLLVYYPDDELGESARILFGLAVGSRGRNLTTRRIQAAETAGYDSDHFRKHVEKKILRDIAWELHRDSQNYMRQSRSMRQSLGSSGDMPTITWEDISSEEAVEHQELLSRVWAQAYTARAEILRVTSMQWHWCELECKNPQQVKEAVKARDAAVQRTRVLLQKYQDAYGQPPKRKGIDYVLDRLVAITRDDWYS